MHRASQSNTAPILLWCVEGTATVNAPERLIPLSAGDLVLAPAGSFISGTATVLPLACSVRADRAMRIRLGSAWNQYMVYEFSRQLVGTSNPSAVLDTLVANSVAAPELPTAPQAKEVAKRLRRRPAQQTSLKGFADELGVSTRTLQRQFLHDTGMIFSEWRAAQRVHLAIRLLEQRIAVAEVARLVGFHAASSLTRAFRRHIGCTPAAFVSGSRRGRKHTQPPNIPHSTIFAKTNADVVVWIHSGTATVTTPGYCRFVAQGDTATIPAGTHTRIDVAAGSVALPMPLEQATEPITLEHIAAHAFDNLMRPLSEPELAIACEQLQPVALAQP